jgi:DNA-binding transcriptional MerR regulator
MMESHQEQDDQPIYNIKAVAEATGLPAATLRAWERRYRALSPGRTASGYRLYSGRDIDVLRWLKARVAEGMNISQAISLLDLRRAREATLATEAVPQSSPLQGPRESRDALLSALIRYDESLADRVLEEAFAVFGLEQVAESIIAPAMVQIGDMWHENRVSTATEHFASNYLRRKLESIVNAVQQPGSGPLVVLGCAPGDWHELGLLLIHLLLRRRHINTIYLGQNVPADRFVEEMTRLRPAMIVMAATTAETAAGLIAIGQAIRGMPRPQPMFAFGGRIFNVEPALRARVPGVFLGESAREGVEHIMALLLRGSAAEPGAILHLPRNEPANP